MWLWLAVALAAEGLDPKLVAEVAATADLPVERVVELLAPVQRDDTVLKRMSTPWEAKPWHQYRKIFLTEERIAGGRAYLAAHAEAFADAEARTGVPAEVVLAIIGVETSYGKNMGGDAVLTSLYTLGFHHQRRGAFFRSELGHYLRLCNEQGWEPASRNGSYAGAMGLGQFMPSSYRKWAVDGDGDGKINLFDSHADAIHSVANYLKDHGWAPGRILLSATLAPGVTATTTKGLQLDATLGSLRAGGVVVDGPEPATTAAKLFAFEGVDGPEHAVALNNFYVITRYNHSPLYARAVTELSESF